MSDVVYLVLIKKLCGENPWRIWNHFIDPPVSPKTVNMMNTIQIQQAKLRNQWRNLTDDVLAMSERFVAFGFRHHSLAFEFVGDFVVATSYEQIRVRKPNFFSEFD